MYKNIRNIGGVALAVSFLLGTSAHADFIANFHVNNSPGTQELFIFGAEGTSGTISGADGFSQNFVIPAGGVYTESLGSGARTMSSNNALNNLSLLVESGDPISGLALNRQTATSDMSVLLDLDGLSTDYRVLTTVGTFDNGSQMSVTATEDNTTVTIDPNNISGLANGVAQVVTLNKGESIFYNSGRGGDLSGTGVVADKKVAVFAGAQCTQVPNGVVACDHVISQQFGTDNYDTEFLVAATAFAGADKDLVRVIADQDNTEIFINGVSQGTINAGEVLTVDNVGNAKITSTKPVSVGQFMRGQGGSRTVGDPAFAIIPAVDQLLKEYAFTTPVNSPFTSNQLNIAIAAADAASLKLNGVAVDTSGFTTLDGILYGNIDIDVGAGVISADNAFLALISGQASFDSYLTPIATSFSAGVSPPPPPTPNPNQIPLPAGAWLLMGGLGILAGAGARRRRKES